MVSGVFNGVPLKEEMVKWCRRVTHGDITRVVAGPFCSMLLADLGATVIKVEHPDDPDYARTFPPFVAGDEGESSAFFAQFNRNKLGITLNMKSEEGRRLLKTLVKRADVLVENFRPGTMEKLGLGYEVLSKENPRLIYTAISGFGRWAAQVYQRWKICDNVFHRAPGLPGA